MFKLVNQLNTRFDSLGELLLLLGFLIGHAVLLVERIQRARFDVLDLRQQGVLLLMVQPCKFGVAVQGGVIDALVMYAAHPSNHAPLCA